MSNNDVNVAVIAAKLIGGFLLTDIKACVAEDGLPPPPDDTECLEVEMRITASYKSKALGPDGLALGSMVAFDKKAVIRVDLVDIVTVAAAQQISDEAAADGRDPSDVGPEVMANVLKDGCKP